MQTAAIKKRIAEIDEKLKAMPKVDYAVDNLPSQIKWFLYTEKRKLNKQLARKKGKHTFSQALEMVRSVNGVCALCGKDNSPSIDHIIPISKGGSDGLENLQVLCISCNASKGNR